MNLRRLLSAAALGLSVGVASAVAEEPADEGSRRELIYTYTYDGLTSSAEDGNASAAALLQYAGAADPENGWPDSVSARNDGAAAPPGETSREYDLSVPFDESTTETLGVVRFIENDYGLIRPGDGEAAAGDSASDKAPYSILYFEKKAYRNAPNTIRIMSERSLSEEPEKDDEEELLIAPLSAPFAMLVMGLGIGFLLVSFTSKTKE